MQKYKLGSYLDIGAGDPIIGSDSYIFYKHGWNGILIEPIARHARLAKKLRERDIVIQTLISPVSNKSLTLYEYETYQYSTTDISVVKKLREQGVNHIDEVTLEATTLNEIIKKYSTVLIPAHILFVDTEGLDYSIIKSINYREYTPDIIVVEPLGLNIVNNKIFKYLISNNYSLVGHTIMS